MQKIPLYYVSRYERLQHNWYFGEVLLQSRSWDLLLSNLQLMTSLAWQTLAYPSRKMIHKLHKSIRTTRDE
jgi:hypothetical protein